MTKEDCIPLPWQHQFALGFCIAGMTNPQRESDFSCYTAHYYFSPLPCTQHYFCFHQQVLMLSCIILSVNYTWAPFSWTLRILESLSLRVIGNFTKGTGLPRLGNQSTKHEGPIWTKTGSNILLITFQCELGSCWCVDNTKVCL
jgi:hypothetical protein